MRVKVRLQESVVSALSPRPGNRPASFLLGVRCRGRVVWRSCLRVCFEEPEWWPGGQVSHGLNAKGNSLPTAGTGSPLPIHKEHGGFAHNLQIWFQNIFPKDSLLELIFFFWV